MKYEFIEYLQQHKQDTLAVTTILQTHGSTPRKAGTTMIVHPDGSIFGTIGGGRAENALKKKERFRRIYVDLNDDVAIKEGMVCGGNMDVLIETYNV